MRRRTRYNDARRLRACRAACEWQQSDVARALDSHAQPALVTRANSGHAPRQNFPALLHELRQDVRALVVDEVHLLDAELANFLLPEILALAARPATGTAGAALPTATRAAFATRTTVAPAVTAMPAFATRHSPRRCCCFLFVCHTYLPFKTSPGGAGINSSIRRFPRRSQS
jgi:hypothetical protein